MPTSPNRPRPGLLARWALPALCLAWACQVRSVAAHPHLTAPPVDLTISVRGTEVLGVLVVDKWQVALWGEAPGFVPDIKRDVPLASILGRLATRFEVELDGQVVMPELRKVTEPSKGSTELMVPTLRIVLAYPAERAPTRIGVRWKDFSGIQWETKVEVALQVEAQGNVDATALTPEEPEYRWHARPPAAFRAPPPPLPAGSPGGRLPVLPLALGALALLLPFLGPLRRRGPRTRWLPATGLLLLAGGLAWVDLGSVATPWGAAQPPTEAQARQITTTLVSNVYRAFDATSEREIYDLLAASVERSLLDGLYADVYESLVLREQGGAVCRVAEVTFGEGLVRFAASGAPTQFECEQAWRVRGAVTHWGHTHERLTQYRARLGLRHDGSAWRIAGIEMLEHKRIDDGTGLPPAPAAPAAPAGTGAEAPK